MKKLNKLNQLSSGPQVIEKDNEIMQEIKNYLRKRTYIIDL